MNWLDVVILLVVAGFVVSAYNAGLLREFVTLIAVIVGVIVAGRLYDDLARDVLVFIGNDNVALGVSFLVLFGAVYLMGQIIALMLKKTASLLMMGWADHLGGAVFGVFKGLIVVEALLILFAAYPQLGLDDAISDSSLAPIFLDNAPVLLEILPGEFKARVEDFLILIAPVWQSIPAF